MFCKLSMKFLFIDKYTRKKKPNHSSFTIEMPLKMEAHRNAKVVLSSYISLQVVEAYNREWYLRMLKSLPYFALFFHSFSLKPSKIFSCSFASILFFFLNDNPTHNSLFKNTANYLLLTSHPLLLFIVVYF